MISKEELRAKGKDAFPKNAQKHRALSQKICEFIVHSPEFHNAEKIGLYVALEHEPDLWPLWEKAPERCYFPKVKGKTLEFYKVRSQKDLKPGFGKIPEPDPNPILLAKTWTQIDLLLVPGLYFDTKGGRIGTGAGFYDRFLSAHSQPHRWGIAWDERLSKKPLVQNENDIRMRKIITPTGIKDCSNFVE